jgi:hypothetical protein
LILIKQNDFNCTEENLFLSLFYSYKRREKDFFNLKKKEDLKSKFVTGEYIQFHLIFGIPDWNQVITRWVRDDRIILEVEIP